MNAKIENVVKKIADENNRATFTEFLTALEAEFPELEGNVKYSQPMYEAHGTFIIGFKPAKAHFSIIPEAPAAEKFKAEIETLGLEFTDTGKVFKVKWAQEIPFALVKKMVAFQLEDKMDATTYFRK